MQEFTKIKDEIKQEMSLYIMSSSIDSKEIERTKAIDIVSYYLAKPIELNDFERILA